MPDLTERLPAITMPVGSAAYLAWTIEYRPSPTPGHLTQHVTMRATITYPPTEVPDAR